MVKDKVKEIVDGMGRLNFIYDDWARANVRLDREKLPAFVFILPTSGSMHYKNNNFRDAPYCLFAFLDIADGDNREFDFDGSENEKTVERMKAEARRFVVALQKSGKFEPISETINYSVVYDELDVNLTGVTIEMQLKEIEGICVENLTNG